MIPKSNLEDVTEAVRAEIKRLHVFLQDLISGHCPDTQAEFAARFGDYLTQEFVIIQPGGVAGKRADIIAGIRSSYGVNPDFRIDIRNVEINSASSGNLVIATYEEWQRNAVNSNPVDNGRVATVIFGNDPSRENGLVWAHVHETWLPDDVMAQGPFDF